MDNDVTKYKNDDNTADTIKYLREIIGGVENPQHPLSKKDLRLKRSTKGGLFSLDPETHTLYFILIDKHNVDFPLYLGDTINYRIAELVVNRSEELLSHQEMYEHIFQRSFVKSNSPVRDLQFALNRFKAVVQEKWGLKPLLKRMFESNRGYGYTLHNKM